MQRDVSWKTDTEEEKMALGYVKYEHWRHEQSSPRSIFGTVKTLPPNQDPLGLLTPSGIARPVQLAIFQVFPAIGADTGTGEAGLVYQGNLLSHGGPNWWTAVTTQLHLEKLIYFCTNQPPRPSTNPWHKEVFKSVASLFALGVFSKVYLGKNTSYTSSTEISGSKNEMRGKCILLHKFQNHDLSLEASSNEQYVHAQGHSWVLPLSLSLNLASNARNSPWYHLGIQHNSGLPIESDNMQKMKVPTTLFPGLQASATFFSKTQHAIWKSRQEGEGKPYDLLKAQPHISLTTSHGGTLRALLGDNMSFRNQPEQDNALPTPRYTTDWFMSLGSCVQFGRFQRRFFDLTILDARYEFGRSREWGSSATIRSDDSPAVHRDKKYPVDFSVVLMLQQQIAGPLSARIDMRLPMGDPSRGYIKDKEIVYGLEQSLKPLGSSKVLAWYSPTRKQGMVEFRIFEE